MQNPIAMLLLTTDGVCFLNNVLSKAINSWIYSIYWAGSQY